MTSQYETNLWSTHVNIVRLAGQIRRCVRWRTRVFNRGVYLQAFPSFPPPPLPLFPFFGFRFISREVKTENSFPRPFFAPKPNWNACYAGHSEWRDCLSQVAQVPGLAEAKADVKRVTQNPGRFKKELEKNRNFYDNSSNPKGLVLFFLLFSSNNRCMGLYGNLAQNRYTALHCDCGLFLRL